MEVEERLKIVGKVFFILYRNEDTFYSVLKVRLVDETEKNLTVVGLFPTIELDRTYNFYGHYVEHPRYGLQFQIENYEFPLPDEREGVIRYLSGAQFKGIGKKTAIKILEVLGDSALSKIKENPVCLYAVEGLSQEKIETITKGLQEQEDGLEELVQFLNVHGIGMRNLIRLNQTYGKEALQKLKENPYRVIEECEGFGFATADKIAMSLGFEKNDERRLYAYLISLCSELCMRIGDTYISYSLLQEQFEKTCEGLIYDYDVIYEKTLHSRKLIQEEERVYPVAQYDSEQLISTFLAQFPFVDLPHPSDAELNKHLDAIQIEFGLQYDAKQVQAIQSFFDYPLQIITGGPGTGKTTVVRALVELFKRLYPAMSIVCVAPTGRAAKRLSELTGTSATTIHSLLKWNLETNTFGVNQEEPIHADLLIIDEFSMVDNWLFSHLLEASEEIRKICIIGDEDQLPSVSPGSLLRDLIESELFPLVRLEHIYRQKEGSDVIRLAHDIAHQTVDFSQYQQDVVFFEIDIAHIKEQVIGIVKNAIEKGYDVNEIQVLSPMYQGAAGIDILNHALQEVLNPVSKWKEEVHYGYFIFREGDKILQLKNQPDDDVYNGDIGTLVEIVDAKNSENHQLTIYVDFDGIIVPYTQETFSNISLAYCISVHKSQGGEYPIVILPIVPQHRIMLQRKLIYTGVTRARQSLVLLGSMEAFLSGIEKQERHVRKTTLKERLLKKMVRKISQKIFYR